MERRGVNVPPTALVTDEICVEEEVAVPAPAPEVGERFGVKVVRKKGESVGIGSLGEGVTLGDEFLEGEGWEVREVEREIRLERDTEGEWVVVGVTEGEEDTRGEREMVGEEEGEREMEGDAFGEEEVEEDGEGFQGVLVGEEEEEGRRVGEAVTLGEREDEWESEGRGGLGEEVGVTP